MKVIVYGANGAMGRKVAELEGEREGFTVAALVSPSFAGSKKDKEYGSIREYKGAANVVIDFSNHSASGELLSYCRSNGMPVVIATTGHTDEEKALIKEASKDIPIFYSANMSMGVAATCELAKKAAMYLPGADIEIVEIHHNRKLDAPSGTALMLANSIKEVRRDSEIVTGRSGHCKRQPNEIGIQSVRLGNIVGTHEVMISTGKETITIRHEAHDRALFADGAAVAAEYLVGKPAGLYNMKDLMR